MTEQNAWAEERLADVLGRARANWGWMVALGVVLVLLGTVAVVQSVLVTIASMMLIGVLMVVGAVMHVVAAFRGQGWKHFLLWLVGGVLYLLAGIGIFANPVLASGFLTLLIAAALLAAGVARIWLGVKARPDQGWGWLVAGGGVTLLLGLIIATGWPVNSLWLIGMFLGVDLMMQGWSYIALGIALRLRH